MSLSRFPQITDELLSAYLDDLVSDEERQLIERAVAADPEIAWQLESLRQTVQLLQTLPALALPKSFVLDAAMVEAFNEDQVEGQPKTPQMMPESATAVADANWWQRLQNALLGRGVLLRNLAGIAALLAIVIFISSQLQPSAPTSPEVAQSSAPAAMEIAAKNPTAAMKQPTAVQAGDTTDNQETANAAPLAAKVPGDSTQAGLATETTATASTDVADQPQGTAPLTVMANRVTPQQTAAVESFAQGTPSQMAENSDAATQMAPLPGAHGVGSNGSTMPYGDDQQPLNPDAQQQSGAPLLNREAPPTTESDGDVQTSGQALPEGTALEQNDAQPAEATATPITEPATEEMATGEMATEVASDEPTAPAPTTVVLAEGTAPEIAAASSAGMPSLTPESSTTETALAEAQVPMPEGTATKANSTMISSQALSDTAVPTANTASATDTPTATVAADEVVAMTAEMPTATIAEEVTTTTEFTEMEIVSATEPVTITTIITPDTESVAEATVEISSTVSDSEPFTLTAAPQIDLPAPVEVVTATVTITTPVEVTTTPSIDRTPGTTVADDTKTDAEGKEGETVVTTTPQSDAGTAFAYSTPAVHSTVTKSNRTSIETSADRAPTATAQTTATKAVTGTPTPTALWTITVTPTATVTDTPTITPTLTLTVTQVVTSTN